jgi:hypothetical protein
MEVSGQLHVSAALLSKERTRVPIEAEDLLASKEWFCSMALDSCENHVKPVYQGTSKNIPDWCRHLYSSCGSAKHR